MEQTVYNKIARIISTIFAPPSFTLLIFIVLAFKFESSIVKSFITIAVASTFGFAFLILLFFYFYKKGQLVNIDASIKEQRTIPFLIAVLFYVIGLLIFIVYKINIISISFWFCYISNTLIIIMINKYWKISVHAMGSAGALAAAVFIWGPLSFLFIILVMLVGWSRIQLKCHSISQVMAGSVLGFVSTFIQMYLIINYVR